MKALLLTLTALVLILAGTALPALLSGWDFFGSSADQIAEDAPAVHDPLGTIENLIEFILSGLDPQ